MNPEASPIILELVKTDGSYKDDGREVNQWITTYGLNSMAKAIASTCSHDPQMCPFMLEESDFWISNRVANFTGIDLDQNLRRVKNWELKTLAEFQELLLSKKFKMPKFLFRFAWCCFLIWVLGMIGVIFLFGVSMDSDAQDEPDKDILEAGTSLC